MRFHDLCSDKGLGLDVVYMSALQGDTREVLDKMRDLELKLEIDYKIIGLPLSCAEQFPVPRLRVCEGNSWGLESGMFYGVREIINHFEINKGKILGVA